MKNYLLFTILLLTIAQATAQNEFENTQKGVIYYKESLVDAKIHTNGLLDMAYQWGTIKRYKLTNFYRLELGYLKHPKEFRQNNSLFTIGRQALSPYTYGKQNSLYIVRALMGQKRFISDKAEVKGVGVGYSYAYGVNLGLLKPYYLDIAIDQNTEATIKYEDDPESFLDKGSINGHAGFFKGWDEVKLKPGLHLKAGLLLDQGAFDKFARSIEAGIMVDFYLEKLPIMISEENKRIFINYYLSIQLGWRK